MYSDKGFVSLKTLELSVGDGITPMSAQIWGDVAIYSQNTAVAVAEGLIVKGVAKGETYIVVESSVGSSEIYYVIVE